MPKYRFQHWNGKILDCFCRPNTIDFDAYQSAINGDEYGFAELGLQEGDTVIDIGAYNGGEGLELAAMGLDLHIISFDPSETNCAMYRCNLIKNAMTPKEDYSIALTQVDKISIVQEAVDGVEGEMGMVYGTGQYNDAEVGKLKQFDGREQRDIVHVTTLPKIFERFNVDKCAVLKLDCEMAEDAIIKSCSDELLDRIKWIVGETHGQGRKNFYNLLRGKFEDLPCKYRTEDGISLFRFRHV